MWKQYADKLIPAGGSTGQVLAKASAQDMDLYWADGTTTQTETTPHMLTNAGRSKKKAIVSFVDDDCRSEAYTVLFPLVQELGMPYTVACPAGLMGKTGRMTVEQLQEMARSGVTGGMPYDERNRYGAGYPRNAGSHPAASLKQRCAAGASAGCAAMPM